MKDTSVMPGLGSLWIRLTTDEKERQKTKVNVAEICNPGCTVYWQDLQIPNKSCEDDIDPKLCSFYLY